MHKYILTRIHKLTLWVYVRANIIVVILNAVYYSMLFRIFISNIKTSTDTNKPCITRKDLQYELTQNEHLVSYLLLMGKSPDISR